ncbi:cell division protein ZapD [Catenovulum sediminis]|uniref:Cell division protein ZapD n=1 Tax=Catenovulum sediminis TaxID=1740262 RepID=A0ABV1RLJ6_9ALTE|nr:cell division protein ZapD [Catenovulum sediminis]
MTEILYEFPLNEKIRTYLRIETLLERIKQQCGRSDAWAILDYLNGLFAILDIIERGDLKSDLLKDLEKHEKQLVVWAEHPSVNNNALQSLLASVIEMSGRLMSSSKLGQKLREDKFLSSIKQRFSIPGGNCCFDLPHLHQWLNQPVEKITQDQNRWLDALDILQTVVELDLKMIREKAKFMQCQAEAGLYQDSVDNVELLRIKLPSESPYYPTVSGHKNRFAIRFMETDSALSKSACQQALGFQLATC